jgi:hypothetical protein
MCPLSSSLLYIPYSLCGYCLTLTITHLEYAIYQHTCPLSVFVYFSHFCIFIFYTFYYFSSLVSYLLFCFVLFVLLFSCCLFTIGLLLVYTFLIIYIILYHIFLYFSFLIIFSSFSSGTSVSSVPLGTLVHSPLSLMLCPLMFVFF